MYLFEYPFIDGNLALWRARARPHSVPCACFRSCRGEPMHISDSLTIQRTQHCQSHGTNTVAANYGSGYAIEFMRDHMEKAWIL